jgi:hypothetical protein
VREPACGIGLPRWETDPFFDLGSNLHRIALPTPGDTRALQALVSDLMSTPLDFPKPLWQMHLIESMNQGCAIAMRRHHCIGDGVALVKVLLDMTDKEAEAPWPGTEPEPEAPAPPAANWQPLGPLFTPAVGAVGNTVAAAGELVSAGMDYLIHPSRFVDAAKLGLAGVLAAGKLELSPPVVALGATLTPLTVDAARSAPSDGQGYPVEVVASAQATAISGDDDYGSGAPSPVAPVVAPAYPASAVLAAPAVHRCTALTVSGEPCRNRTLPGSTTCHDPNSEGT